MCVCVCVRVCVCEREREKGSAPEAVVGLSRRDAREEEVSAVGQHQARALDLRGRHCDPAQPEHLPMRVVHLGRSTCHAISGRGDELIRPRPTAVTPSHHHATSWINSTLCMALAAGRHCDPAQPEHLPTPHLCRSSSSSLLLSSLELSDTPVYEP